MSETKWTPGPWRVIRSETGRVYVRDDGGLIAEGPRPITFEGQDARFKKELSEYEANARLISAAPDLADALETLLARWLDPGSITTEHWEAARAALRKAKGETT